MSVRAHIQVNYFKLFNILWYVAGKNGCSSLILFLEELRERKREFVKVFLRGLVIFKNVVVSEKNNFGEIVFLWRYVLGHR